MLSTTWNLDNLNVNPKKDVNISKDFVVASYKKCKFVSHALLIFVVGIILVSQNFTVDDTDFIGQNYKRNESVNSVQSVEKNTARLARVMNAIILQNEFGRKARIMKEVMAEVLDVKKPFVIDPMEKTSIRDALKDMKIISLSINKTKNTVNNAKSNLHALKIQDDITLPKSPISQILFSVNISNFDIGEMVRLAKQTTQALKNLLNSLKTHASYNYTRSCYFQFNTEVNLYRYYIKQLKFDDDVKKYAEFLKSMKSFIIGIDYYLKSTDQIHLKNLTKSLKVLAQLSKTIEPFFKPDYLKHVEKIFNNLYKLFNTTGKASDKKILIGFPRGTKDMDLLLNDLDDDWLKKVLNKGKTLDQLKHLLVPVYNLKSLIALEENSWGKPARNNYSNFLQRSLKIIKQMKSWKPKSVINCLKIVNDTLIKLRPIAKLNNSILIDFKHFLSLSDIFTNFTMELKTLPTITQRFDSYYDCLMKFLYDSKVGVSNESLIVLRNSIPTWNFDLFYEAVAKAEFLERQKQIIAPLLNKFVDFKNTLTDDIFINIYNIVKIPKEIHSKISFIEKYINFLSIIFLEDIAEIDNISNLLFAADDWKKLEKHVYTEIKQIEGFHRLESFPFAREITSQLSFSQRTLVFYKRLDLRQIIQRLLLTTSALSYKIMSLPPVEKKFCSAWDSFFPLNLSLNTFLSDIEALPVLFPPEKMSLQFLANSISALDSVNLPNFSFSLILSTIDKLKSTSIGRSQEVLDVEKAIEHFDGLHFAAMRKKGSLPKLLKQADIFFQSFFTINLATNTFWQPLVLVGITMVVVLVSVLAVIFLWIRNIKIE